MRKYLKYLAPVVLILALAGVGAIAQNVTKALQLSQDASGAFGVDSTNNVYFPGHVLNNGASQNTPITITGTGTPTIAGTDVAGLITMGASATTAIALFGRPYVTVPHCVVTWQGGLATTAVSYTLLTTSITLAQPSTSTNKINYFCTGLS